MCDNLLSYNFDDRYPGVQERVAKNYLKFNFLANNSLGKKRSFTRSKRSTFLAGQKFKPYLSTDSSSSENYISVRFIILNV